MYSIRYMGLKIEICSKLEIVNSFYVTFNLNHNSFKQFNKIENIHIIYIGDQKEFNNKANASYQFILGFFAFS